ncbi:MAG TPA: DinB family protein [Gemmatimonadaceae bacterium]|nr:DinB family protein [Gemmatimonadaceae bacterium]
MTSPAVTTTFLPAWLRAPLPDIPALLQPVAQALVDADEDVQKFVPPLSQAEIATRPAGAASVVYHVRHAMGSLDRLFTYARGETLSEEQLRTLGGEKTLDAASFTAIQLASDFSAAVQRALAQLRMTSADDLLKTRFVGRSKTPSTTIACLFHGAEHTARHVGQIVTTARIVRPA